MKPVQQQLDDINRHLGYMIDLTEGLWIKNKNGDMYIPDMIENISKEIEELQSDIAHQDFLKLCGVNESEINSY